MLTTCGLQDACQDTTCRIFKLMICIASIFIIALLNLKSSPATVLWCIPISWDMYKNSSRETTIVKMLAWQNFIFVKVYRGWASTNITLISKHSAMDEWLNNICNGSVSKNINREWLRLAIIEMLAIQNDTNIMKRHSYYLFHNIVYLYITICTISILQAMRIC